MAKVLIGNIKGPQGTPGKTAYEYAQDGGFSGTEAEFMTMLASKNNVLGSDTVVESDVDMKSYTLTNLKTPTANTEASTRQYTDSAKSAAISEANSYTDTAKSSAISTANSYTDTAKSSAISTANSYTDTAKAAAISESKTYADTKMDCVVLWQNASYSSDFTAQTISLDLSGYSHVAIDCAAKWTIVKVGASSTFTSATFLTSDSGTNMAYVYARRLSCDSSGVVFEDCKRVRLYDNQMSFNMADNGNCKPSIIYGIKGVS